MDLLNETAATGSVNASEVAAGVAGVFQPGWIQVVTDAVLATGCLAVAGVLLFFVGWRRQQPFASTYYAFASFYAAFGLVSLTRAIAPWQSVAELAVLFNALTAIALLVAVGVLQRSAPALLDSSGLVEANARLKSEVASRRQAQQELLESNHELREFTNAVLDREERIIELKQEVNTLLLARDLPARYGQQT